MKNKANLSMQEAESLFMTDITYKDYYNRLKTIALSIFSWENLPETCNRDFLELSLYRYGQACLLKDKGVFINTNCSNNGAINMYELPTRLNCYTANGDHYMRDLYIPNSNKSDEEEAILVKNNINRYPTKDSLMLYAKRLANAERTIDINIHNVRNPILILCDKKNELSLRNFMAQYDNYYPEIFGAKELLDENGDAVIKALNIKSDFIADKIESYKRNVWNEALTYLGVNNISNEKSERLITSESEVNNEVINYNLQYFLKAREKACEEFNKKFNQNVKVTINSDLQNIIKNTLNTLPKRENPINNKGGEENE